MRGWLRRQSDEDSVWWGVFLMSLLVVPWLLAVGFEWLGPLSAPLFLAAAPFFR